ncbi:hypothetical protein IWQ60_011172 [Tieghemiomyces parasiticus]|uniref:Molybdopterin synthase sulfur carrier subunit n=1 Tax=Tieghemiomyces parasiticus TaxID=78921 RepID=A0A9W8DIQ6_9FUNG|nr:hypothetical protein IWQ60_011172 [Tieghemiomyces parasiticus]
MSLPSYKVCYFASTREAVGGHEYEQFDFPADQTGGLTVQQAVDRCRARHPQLVPQLGSCLVALNHEIVSDMAETLVRAGDELALIPPVSGG